MDSVSDSVQLIIKMLSYTTPEERDKILRALFDMDNRCKDCHERIPPGQKRCYCTWDD